MKTSILFILFLGITYLGCSDNFDDAIVSTSIQSEELNKSISAEELNVLPPTEEFPGSPNYEVLVHSTNSKFNAGGDTLVNPQIIVSKFIDGEVYSEFRFDTTYVNSEGREIEVHAKLKFNAGAFEGSRLITISPNPEDLSIKLLPHMTFNERVKLDYEITGLDLEAMGFPHTNSHVDFVYFSPNGDIELIQNDQSNVHPNQQTIRIQGGKLNHFSRYGWVR